MRNHHESNRKWNSLSNSFRCRYVGKRPCRYPQDTAESFVKWSSAGLLHSDDNGGSEPFGTGGDTHTRRTRQKIRPQTNQVAMLIHSLAFRPVKNNGEVLRQKPMKLVGASALSNVTDRWSAARLVFTYTWLQLLALKLASLLVYHASL